MDADNHSQRDEHITTTDIDDNTQLHRAVMKNDAEHLNQLLADSRIDINKQNMKGETALHVTAKNGYI